MFGEPLTGGALPPRTLCLTFDDGPGETSGSGPGPRTLELARYLAEEAVPATFFLSGKHVLGLPDVAHELVRLGHLVGNHSQEHLNLPELLASGGDVVAEVRATAELLAGVAAGPLFFRPPYGAWSPEVAAALNADPELARTQVGPVLWDVDGSDWRHWRDGGSPQGCADDYLARIEATGRGIVLQHDCTADSDAIKAANRTFETVLLLVPELKRRGYAFVGLADALG